MAGGGPAFCPVRPPGHHATPARAMGFCLLNNVAIAARVALDRLGAERVLIVDWDVHHGNGTADAFRTEPRVRYVSLHQWPFYPGTGAEDDVGVGNLFHVPRPPGLPRERYVADLLAAVDRAVAGFAPDPGPLLRGLRRAGRGPARRLHARARGLTPTSRAQIRARAPRRRRSCRCSRAGTIRTGSPRPRCRHVEALAV